MSVTEEQYKAMKSFQLPFKSADGSFVLSEINGVCRKCRGKLADMRGEIKETFEVIDIVTVGRCTQCGDLVGCHSRIYLKTNEFAEEHKEGWERTPMKTLNEVRKDMVRNFLSKISILIFVPWFASMTHYNWDCRVFLEWIAGIAIVVCLTILWSVRKSNKMIGKK